MKESRIQVPDLTRDLDQQNKLLMLQNSILEDFVKWQMSTQELLDQLCRCAEALTPRALASIMLFNDSDLLSVRSAPSAPQEVIDVLVNIKPSPTNGSCANAVFSGEPSFVNNTSCDEPWADIRFIAERFGIKACWSFPVFDERTQAIGSFALSSMEHRLPDDFQTNVLKVCANLVSLIIQREEQKKQLWHLANHDALTDLPNRLFLDTQLEHAIQNAKRDETRIALMFLDLDNFKDINDSFGHDFGDLVLLKSMELIKSCIREGDLVTRHGGDEFLILLENLTDQMSVDTIAQKMLEGFKKPMLINEQKLTVSFSIGIAFYPDDASTVVQLIKHSDIAMYQAKKKGKNGIQFFAAELAEQIAQKVQLEQEMHQALLTEEFELYYQPQYIKDTDKIDSIEVLIRWNHPTRGLLYPADFLPIAEKSSLIREISIYVFKKASRQGAEWLAEGYDIPKIAVNFSTTQLTDCCAERLDLLLDTMGFPAEKMEVEVTETLVINRGQSGIDELKKMRSLGVTLAMDDFGTGYSSLSQLRNMPMHKLKIDRSFVKDLEHNIDAQVIAKTIIVMGQQMGMSVVAEGVETKWQQQFLLDNGCDYIQGYYRHYPVAKSEIELLFRKTNG